MRINDILKKENLGKLSNVINAYGVTDTGERVWLPQVNVNDNWVNVVLVSDEVIVQFGKTHSPHQKRRTIWDPAVVITRDKTKDIYNRLDGKYRPIFCDINECITVHAKETLPIAQGTATTAGSVSWITGFARTAEEAREKAILFREKARHELATYDI